MVSLIIDEIEQQATEEPLHSHPHKLQHASTPPRAEEKATPQTAELN